MSEADDFAKLTEQTNPSLIRKIKDRGNVRAWTQFDSLYRPMLRRFARARGFSDADVEDVVQHCMTAICMNIEKFNYDPARGRFKSWLRTLVNNRCRDLVRSRRAPTADVDQLDAVVHDANTPADAFDKIWIEEHFNHCLHRLCEEVDHQDFTAFHRYAVEGQSPEEVCRDLAITRDYLYKLKWRLTKRLGEWMRELVGEEFTGLAT